MRKLKTLIGIGLISLALAGCAPQSWSEDENGVEVPNKSSTATTEVFEQPMPNGKSVTCVTSYIASGAGLSCDWEGYHIEYPESE